jgi:transcription initiation factor TFIID subunit 1, fungi type
MELAQKEEERLNKNKERRHKREKQKKLVQKTQGGSGAAAGSGDEGSPERTTEKVGGTTRKCANCGQIGHIKTNKKLCPLLNGTIQRDNPPEENAGLGSLNAPMAASFLGAS